MQYITLLVYIGLGLLHLFLVKEVTFLLVLVALFEVVRLLAVYYKIRLVVVVLAIFSSVFIVVNYSNMYANNKSNIYSNNQMNQDISSYVNKYWVNQDKFLTLIEKQESNIKNIVNLPSTTVVASLVLLIELSMCYIVCVFKSQSNNTNTLIEKKNNSSLSFLKSEVGNKFKIINGEYFFNNEKIGRTKFYELKKGVKNNE